MKNTYTQLYVVLCITIFAGCCGQKEVQIVEREFFVPATIIRDTVYLIPPDFVLNPSCDTAAILARYCNPIVEHTDTAGNYWQARYVWSTGRFIEYVKTHPQIIKYIDTTLNITYKKIDPTFWWKAWFGFQIVATWTFVLLVVGVVLYVLSRVKVINLPFGL